MCGRFTYMFTWAELHRLATLTTEPASLGPSYNVAPTHSAPVIRQQEGARRLDFIRWGLVPSWMKESASQRAFINARAETVATKATFRRAFESRRCLVPASGFYEWQKLPDGTKQPHYICSTSGEPFFFAGLWEPAGSDGIETFTILTTCANELVATLHDRMPVILDPADFTTWLDSATPPEVLTSLLRPYPAERMRCYAVSKTVNSPGHNTAECLTPIAAGSHGMLFG